MIHRTILSCIALLIWLPLASQKIEVSQSIEFNVRNDRVNVLGMHENIIYTHIAQENNHYIWTMHTDLRSIDRKLLPVDTRRFDLETLRLHNGRLQLFLQEKHKGDLIIWTQQLNTRLDSIAPKTPVDTIVGRFGMSMPSIQINHADNEKYTAVYYLEPIANSRDLIHITLLKNDLTIARQWAVPLETSDQKHTFHELLVDNTGGLYIITATFQDSDREYIKSFSVLRSSLAFNAKEQWIIEMADQRFANNTLFTIDNINRHLVIAGFYAEDYRKPVHAEGIYYEVVDLENAQRISRSYKAFPAEFIAKIKGTRNPKRTDKLYSFVIDKIILRQDGGALLVAESYYRTYRATNTMYDIYGIPMRSETTVTFHFDEILVLSIHPDGEIHWKNIIPKSQSSTGDYGRYGSYAMMNTGKYLLFFFNEDLSNRTNVMQYIISSTGEMNRSVMLNSRRYKIYLLPQYGRQVAARTFIVPSIRKDKLSIVKISY